MIIHNYLEVQLILMYLGLNIFVVRHSNNCAYFSQYITNIFNYLNTNYLICHIYSKLLFVL